MVNNGRIKEVLNKMFREYIDMSNNNSFIALSFIRETENPYELFCKYIEYCLSKEKNNSLTYDKLLLSFKNNSGLNIPNYIFSHCLKIMFSSRSIIKTNNETSYKLVKKSIDINEFENQRKILDNQNLNLINNLIEFVSNEFNKKWDYTKAQNRFSNFLLAGDNAYSIFIDINTLPSYDKYSDEWIIQAYVKVLQDKKNIYYDYLMDVINGLAIYMGTLYTDPNENTLNINDTDFYLDTKLVLRYLGYSTEIYSQSIRQLVDLIKINYGGNICVFEHTVSEVGSALYNAHIALYNNQDIFDDELRFYQRLNNVDSDDLRVYSESIQYELEQNDIRIQKRIQWEDDSCWINSINENLLFEEIKKHRKHYKKTSIDNDVNAMNQINMLRNGEYTVHFGGDNKLPIFVTSNTLLVKNVKDFILKDIEEDSNSNWKIGKMPIISDTALMCKLWANSKEKNASIPELLFSKNAHSILAYDDAFFSNLKERSVQLKEKYEFKILNLPDERLEKIEKLIIKNNNGNIDELSDDELYFTIEESYKVDKMALEGTVQLQKEIIEEKNNIINTKDETISLKEKQLISAYSDKYTNKLGINICLIILGKYWWVITTAMFAFISYWAFPKFNITNNIPFFIKIIFSALPICAVIILEIIKKYAEKEENLIKEKLIEKACNNYKKKITSKLSPEELEFKKEILDYCIEHTKYFERDKDTN